MAAACVLVEDPIPPGTSEYVVVIHNDTAEPAVIAVRTSAGTGAALAGSVRPSLVPAGATARVVMYLQPGAPWVIDLDEGRELNAQDVVSFRQPCTIQVTLDRDGWGWGC